MISVRSYSPLAFSKNSSLSSDFAQTTDDPFVSFNESVQGVGDLYFFTESLHIFLRLPEIVPWNARV